MDGVSGQRPDGSWGPVEPIGYAPGIDWEVGRGATGGREANAYVGARLVATVRAHSRFGLRLGILVARIRLWLRGVRG